MIPTWLQTLASAVSTTLGAGRVIAFFKGKKRPDKVPERRRQLTYSSWKVGAIERVSIVVTEDDWRKSPGPDDAKIIEVPKKLPASDEPVGE